MTSWQASCPSLLRAKIIGVNHHFQQINHLQNASSPATLKTLLIFKFTGKTRLKDKNICFIQNYNVLFRITKLSFTKSPPFLMGREYIPLWFSEKGIKNCHSLWESFLLCSLWFSSYIPHEAFSSPLERGSEKTVTWYLTDPSQPLLPHHIFHPHLLHLPRRCSEDWRSEILMEKVVLRRVWDT